MKKEVLRTCTACRQKKDKKDLFRIIRTPEGNICFDETGRSNGRGVYICKSMDCFLELKKKNMLSKSLKQNVSKDVYDEIEVQVKEALLRRGE